MMPGFWSDPSVWLLGVFAILTAAGGLLRLALHRGDTKR